MTLADIPNVAIDPSGGHKFIVAKLTDGNSGEKLVVRANKNCSNHDDILDLLRNEVRPNGLKAMCIGGGGE